MNVLVIDAYDSFVYTVAHYVAMLGVEPTVVRNSEVRAETIEAWRPACILMGPGPGHPANSGYIDLIRKFAGKIPIFGICLGHQAIGMCFGGRVIRGQHLMHGKVSTIEHDGRGCFERCANPLQGMRYHSLIVDAESIPDCLAVTAISEDDRYVMGLRHRHHAIESIQFHPESISSQDGLRLLENFIGRHARPRP